MLHNMLISGITEEAAAAWWLLRYTGSTERIIRAGRISRAGTPLHDTSWLPSLALIALIYRELKWKPAHIARQIGKSHHAVADLFARVDAAEVVCG